MFVCRGALACTLVVLAAPTAAQARVPCTGTVRTLDGAPLADATVTCAFTLDGTALGVPDRVATTTDAAGRFRADLVVGQAYVVWVIGPAGEGGERVFVPPTEEASGGRILDLVAGVRRGPVRLEVRGAMPWIHDGPLALRILLPGRCVLGPDLVIPGDGTFTLPPLPAAQVAVVLVDGKGQPLDVQPLDLAAARSVTFSAPTEASVLATDPEGKPLAGVRVLQTMQPRVQNVGFFPDIGCPEPPWPPRIVATTGADGRAKIKVAENVQLLRAVLDGRRDSISGWLDEPSGKRRLHDGVQVADRGGPLEFVLAPVEPTALRVLGAPAEDLQVVFVTSFMLRLAGGFGVVPATYPAALQAGRFPCAHGDPALQIGTRIRIVDDSLVPQRILALERTIPELDLAELRRYAVEVIDAHGRPVPCVQIGVTQHRAGVPVRWLERLVTDATGRAELRLGLRYDLVVYATTGSAHGVHVVRKGDAAGPIRIELRPLATARIRVFDAQGGSVAGARLEYTSGALGVRSADDVGQALDRLAGSLNPVAIERARSDAAGEIRVAFSAREGVSTSYKAVDGARESASFTLTAGDDVQQLVVR